MDNETNPWTIRHKRDFFVFRMTGGRSDSGRRLHFKRLAKLQSAISAAGDASITMRSQCTHIMRIRSGHRERDLH